MSSETIEPLLEKYPALKKENLLPLLQDIQSALGHLSDESLDLVAKHLNLPLNRVHGVATFYDQFRFQGKGQHHVRICKGTACHLNGSSTYLKEIEKHLRVRAGHISKDRRYSLEIANCLGACQSAPVIEIDGIYYTNVTPAQLHNLLSNLKEKPE